MSSLEETVEQEPSSCEDIVHQFEPSVSESIQYSDPAVCFKPKCKVRRFSSKAALLVLIWNSLVNIIFGSTDSLIHLFGLESDPIATIVPYLVWLLSALLSGWLADVHLGQYRMAKIGIILVFISAVLQSALIVAKNLSSEDFPPGLSIGLVTVLASMGYGSIGITLVTLPQVGFDQMPDSSAANITSFIAWFVVSLFGSFWISEASFNIGTSCFGKDFSLVWSLFPVVCTVVVLITDFFLTPKWMIIEPKSPQSLKNLYRVLKFAKQHKAPVNRSAFTYWEEDIPSRLDLGKSRYGGPFTTEQVEDVKTLLRILALSIPMLISLTAYYLYQLTIPLLEADPVFTVNGTRLSNCSSSVLEYFTYEWEWLAIIAVLVYEFALYPLIGHKTPSSLRRIGAVNFLILITNIICLSLTIYYSAGYDIHIGIAYVHSLGVALLLLVLLTSAFEFVCAQSPYNMRGLLLGYIWCISLFAYAIAQLINGCFVGLNKSLFVIYSVVATLMSFFGFVLYCILARWYKRRKRDDIPTPHRWVEDAYDRYLSVESTR